MNSLADLLKQVRKGLGMTQAEAAQVMRTTREWWNKVENGHGPIPRDAIGRLKASVETGQIDAMRRRRAQEGRKVASQSPGMAAAVILEQAALMGATAPETGVSAGDVWARLMSRKDLPQGVREHLEQLGVLMKVAGLDRATVPEAEKAKAHTRTAAVAAIGRVMEAVSEMDGDGSMTKGVLQDVGRELGFVDPPEEDLRPKKSVVERVAERKAMEAYSRSNDIHSAYWVWKGRYLWPVLNPVSEYTCNEDGGSSLLRRAAELNVDFDPRETLQARVDEASARWEKHRLNRKRTVDKSSPDDWPIPVDDVFLWSVEIAIDTASVLAYGEPVDCRVNDLPPWLWPWSNVAHGQMLPPLTASNIGGAPVPCLPRGEQLTNRRFKSADDMVKICQRL